MSDSAPPIPPVEGSQGPAPRVSGRRTAAIATVTAGTLAVVGIASFAAVHFLGGGPQAEKALPSTVLAVASIDLDPSASQKVEAIKTLRRFPELRNKLDVSSGDDLRKKFFDEALRNGDCKQLSYAADVEPWIGDSVAIAAVGSSNDKVTPLLALAVTDQDRAAKGLKALLACSGSDQETAVAFNDGFALISDTQAHADQAVKDARQKALTDDPAYQKWTDKVGDRGIANFYVAKAAAGYLGDLGGLGGLSGGLPTDLPTGFPSDFPTGLPSDFPTDLPTGFPSDFPTGLPSDFPTGLPTNRATLRPTGGPSLPPMPQPTAGPADAGGVGASAPYAHSDGSNDAPAKALKNFQGAAGALRFSDGGLELEVVGGGLTKTLSGDQQAGNLVTALPKDTAAAVAVAVPKDFAANLLKGLEGLDIPLVGTGNDLESQAEGQLGLSLPDDLTELLGQGIAVSVSGTPPADLGDLKSPEDLSAGLTIKGDPDKVEAVITKLTAKAGMSKATVTVVKGDGRVAVAFAGSYARELTKKGALGDNDTFTTVVPDADKATFVAYVDLNSAWREAIAKELGGKDGADLLANTAPLKALGLSGWVDGDTSHVLLKVTTD